MARCFVIQPFDNGPFDRRYHDTIKPAIEAAGLEAYRVDRDPSVVIPIEQIQNEIRLAAVCVADISTLNANVWFELGFAIAAKKQVVLLALEEENQKFPFDIQHRQIIRYKKESRSDFEILAAAITEKLRALLDKEEQLERVVEPASIADIEGLTQHEIVALVTIAENGENSTDGVGIYQIRSDMERAGFTRVAVMLGLTLLGRKRLVLSYDETDINGNDYTLYGLSDDGVEWLIANQHAISLRRKGKTKPDHDEIPF